MYEIDLCFFLPKNIWIDGKEISSSLIRGYNLNPTLKMQYC